MSCATIRMIFAVSPKYYLIRNEGTMRHANSYERRQRAQSLVLELLVTLLIRGFCDAAVSDDQPGKSQFTPAALNILQ
jgi:hypothetical protein